jgi:hypothetical protein
MNAAARLRRAGCGTVLLLLAAWLPACGEDAPRDRPEPPGSDSGMKPDAGRPDAGRAYDGTCGGDTCPDIALGRPCCTRSGTGEKGNEFENVGRGANLCGADLGEVFPSLDGICLQVGQPGEVHPSCPPQVPIAGGPPLPGCCTEEGFCGGLEEAIPLGCFYATGQKGVRCTAADGGMGGDQDAGGR